MESMVPFNNHIANGKLKTQYARIKPRWVSKRRDLPFTLINLVYSKYNGSIKAAGGAIRLVIAQKKKFCDPFTRNLDKAYVANNARNITNTVLPVEMMREFIKKLPYTSFNKGRV